MQIVKSITFGNKIETKIVYACTNNEISLIYKIMNEVLKAIYIAKKSLNIAKD